MKENYMLEIAGDHITFTRLEKNAPDFASKCMLPAAADDFELSCRMGDPDLLECLAYRHKNSWGGIFALRDKAGLLYTAQADTALIWSIGLGYFGKLASYVRYGADIFENLEVADD